MSFDEEVGIVDIDEIDIMGPAIDVAAQIVALFPGKQDSGREGELIAHVIEKLQRQAGSSAAKDRDMLWNALSNVETGTDQIGRRSTERHVRDLCSKQVAWIKITLTKVPRPIIGNR
jgi:hypothetical protein